MHPQFQSQPAFQHIRHSTPSASPPIPNGVFPHHPQQRQYPHPQPGSRPSSRNDPRRQSSNLVPQGPHHPPPQNGYAYMPNPAIYNPHTGPGIPPHPHGLPPHPHSLPMQGAPQGVPQQGPQYLNYGPPQQHPHPPTPMFSNFMRRNSGEVQCHQLFPSKKDPLPVQNLLPAAATTAANDSTAANTRTGQQQLAPQHMLEPVKRMSVKSRSIFTPIDESRSILSQHWASSASNAESSRSDAATSNNRSQSVDVGAVSRITTQPKPASPPPQRFKTHNKTSSIAMASVPDGFTPPSRTNSAQLSGGGKRPVLKVQIPDEPSDGGSNTVDSNSSPHSSTNPGAQHRASQGHDQSSSSVVLPPPSPSASALLSAGASGPPNPFARPHPVSQNSTNSQTSNIIDTPVSALPSRFMTNEFLPSPSSFYPEWSFGGRENNTLPSPLNFATPVVGTGPSFLREDGSDRAGERRGSAGGGGGIHKEDAGARRGGRSEEVKHNPVDD